MQYHIIMTTQRMRYPYNFRNIHRVGGIYISGLYVEHCLCECVSYNLFYTYSNVAFGTLHYVVLDFK